MLTRLFTALVLAPVFLWALYLGSLPFLALVFLMTILCLWEFHRMAEEGGHATQGFWGIGAGAAVSLAMALPGLRPTVVFPAQATAWAVTAAAVVLVAREMARRDMGLSVVRLGMSFLGIFLIAFPLGYLGLLRDLRGSVGNLERDPGFWASVFLIVLVWTQDTGAYVVGLSLGKHRLAPAISPKKSWEGAVGGLLTAVLVSLALRELFLKNLFGRVEIVFLATVLGILAQMSDLMESMMKRCFGVKDSSALLPGHGGVLDRFDSFLLSTPFLYFYLISVGKYG